MAHCSDTGKGDKLMNSTVAAATKPSNTNNKIKHSTGENVQCTPVVETSSAVARPAA